MNIKENFDREGNLDIARSLKDIIEYLNNGIDFLMLKKLHKPPAKLRTGMVVLADGSDWNPGSGAGFYGYNAGSWTKLG